VFVQFYRRIYRHISEMRWDALLALGVGHFLISWALCAAVDPSDLTQPDVFWYFYFVTATTVGYGDFSPSTALSRMVAVFWIMPGAIALFTTAIAKAAQAMAELWRRNMRGGGDFSKLDGHFVLIGWRGDWSERLLTQLADIVHGAPPEIVVLAASISQNPAPDRVRFVRAETISDEEAFERAGIATATCAVVMAKTDADALAGALAAASFALSFRLVAYFEDERMAHLLKSYCPRAETAPSLSVELLARAARDAGSAEVLFTLASSQEGPTQFSMLAPDAAAGATFGETMVVFKRDHGATLLGQRPTGASQPTLNPDWSDVIAPGDRLYYVAPQRLLPDDIVWPTTAGPV